MEAILVEKSPTYAQASITQRDSTIVAHDSFVSPRNRLSIGSNNLLARNIPPAKVSKISAHFLPLQSIVNNIVTPKRSFHKQANPSLSINPLLSIGGSVSDKTEELHSIRVVKSQPKISNNHHLPSVFSAEKGQAIKIKKLVSKQKLEKFADFSVDQDNLVTERLVLPSPNHRDRNSRSFLSPARLMSPISSVQNQIAGLRINSNRLSRNENQPYLPVTRESARRLAVDNYGPLKTEESNTSITTGTNSNNNKKKIIVFKKFLSKSPESKVPVYENSHQNFSNAIKLLDQFAAPIVKPKTKISLNEMITLKKVKTTANNGIMKRMLHAPSLNIYDIQEEPIKAHENLKDWISEWKRNFQRKENKNIVRIFTSFWNSPEGSVSILMEATRKGSLQDLLDTHLALPENCIQIVAREIVSAIADVHQLVKRPHGAISASEIFFDSQCQPKLSPGISHQSINKQTAFQINKQDSDKDDALTKFFLVSNRVTSANELSSGSPSHRNLGFNNHNLNNNANNANSNQNTNANHAYASDIFDFGYMLLICALGNLDFYDANGFYALENIKSALDLLPSYRRYNKNYCCLLHSEEELRKFQESLASTTTRGGETERKTPLTNNFYLKTPKNQDVAALLQNKKPTVRFTLLELLQERGRYSESFIEFLCNCLKFNPSSRLEARSLKDHEFVSESHISSGPMMSLQELFKTVQRENESIEAKKSNEERLNRLCEAIKIVLMNQDAKDKVFHLGSRKEYEKPLQQRAPKAQRACNRTWSPYK